MKLNLSATEGRKILYALRDLALDNGWNEDELEESGVLAEYGAAIDAAMKAIGLTIDINPDEEDDEEDFEEEDFEDNFEEDFEEDEDEDEDDTAEYSLTVKGDFVLRYVEAGHSFGEAIVMADLLFGEGE